MKSLFHILIVLLIFTIEVSSMESGKSVFYTSIQNEVKVYRYENFRKNKIPLATLNKGDAVKIVEILGSKMKISLKDGSEGFVFTEQFVKVSDYQNSLMNEIEVLSDLDELEPVFIIEDDADGKIGGKKVKFIEKSFMTEAYIVNLDIYDLERLIRISKYNRR